jgi:leucyl aminopeptidase (aminopeptidase T)
LIITDRDTLTIGEALKNEVLQTGAEIKFMILEDYGARPMTDLPAEIKGALTDEDLTVSFFAAQGQPGEIKMRIAMLGIIASAPEGKSAPVLRHGHMINISPQLIEEGMTADYQEIYDRTLAIHERVKNAAEIKVTSAKGTDITARFNPDYRWKPCHGLYHQPGDWGNLPEGELFTCPQTLDGVLVVDVLGDYFSDKYGVLESPLHIQVVDGLVTEISGENMEIAQELMEYLDSAENGRRAGEFAIGTNTAITHLTGNLLQDEKIPGIHVAFGDPYRRETGADWVSEVHVDVIPTNCTITVDGLLIMDKGKFVI